MDDCEAYFNQIYDATYPRILRWAVIKTSCAEDAADLVQEVYQRFYARIKKHGTRDINSAEAYLSGLMRRELATHYRQKSKKSAHESPLDKTDFADDTVAFESQVCERCDSAAVWRIVSALPQNTYKSFVLFYGFDASIEEIAGQLGISQENVKTRLYRARQAARSAMKGVSDD